MRRAADLRLSAGLDPARLVSCVSREDGGTLRGRITDYLRTAEFRPDDLFYLSGNPLAVKDVLDLLGERGVPAARIVREFYYAY